MTMTRRQRDEFTAFVQARGSALLRTAHLLTGDRGHAEDLLQQALERLARRWDRIQGDPEAYVRRSLVNLSTDRWRLARRRPQEVAPEVGGRSSTADPHQRVEDRLDLLRAMQRLTPRQRAVLVLRYFEDLSEEATAGVLGCSVGTVKSTASRAISSLRQSSTDRLAIPSAKRSTS